MNKQYPPLTPEQMHRLSSEIYNCSRRIRQQVNLIQNQEPAKAKLIEQVNKLNEIGNEIAGGREAFIDCILRKF